MSVFDIDGMSDSEIHTHGVAYATRLGPPPKRPKALGKIPLRVFLDQKLTFDRDEPPPRHGVVKGWPIEKSEQKLIAQQLAAAASAPCFPSSPATTA
jgi:hypothetical protein